VRILLVEDNEPLAKAMRQVLLRRGHHCVRTADGLEAQELLATGAVFEVVLSDVEMPRLDGLGLLRWIMKNRTELVARCIFLTGRPDGAIAAEIAAAHGAPVLAKPLEAVRLFALIDAIGASSTS
jgi:CheY-like chemotaxis protein